MTTRNDRQKNACIFQWKIDNISQCCWLEKEVEIVSPTFITDEVNGSKWSLRMYPLGRKESENFVGLFLKREQHLDDDREIVANYELAFLKEDGTVLKRMVGETPLMPENSVGWSSYESLNTIFLTQRKEFLPEDSLTIQCKLREITDQSSLYFKHTYARSVFKVQRRSVFWKIDKFSTVKGDLRNKFKDSLIDLDLILRQDAFSMKVVSYDDSIKYISVNISIIDSEGRKTNVGVGKFNGHNPNLCEMKYGKFESTPYYISCIPNKLMKHKFLYIPNNVLTLYIKYAYSSVANSYESLDSITVSSQLTQEVVENNHELYVGKDKSQNTLVLIDDLKSMYTNKIFSDIKLQTSSQTFPVHRNILSARSPVFSRMFSHDMKEKNSGDVHIIDLENDTLHQMLLFIYTNFLENLQFESASKLYLAAVKYEILSLKSKCSTLLKDNMCPTKACDVLILADLHQDEDLKSFMQAYILGHNEVFALKEWKHLMKNHLKLAADIMYKKIQPCNE